MNGSNSMYEMRPIIKLAEEIELPKCMYKMKVIQNSHCVVQNEQFANDKLAAVISEQINKFLKKPIPEVIALENRQEAILVQLAQLKQQLYNLREQLKQPPVFTNTVHCCESSSYKNEISEEIVVKANPKTPPYSLLALNYLLHNSLNINSYVHSAAGDIIGDLKCFEKTCSSPLFNIRLIWKDIRELEFLINPTKHTVITTEVNLLRFLSRMGPPKLNYEACGDVVAATIADALLDTCHKLVKETTAKARQIHLKAFSAILQKQQFLMGNNVSLVDIAGWSALKQTSCMPKDLPVSINKWFERCNEIFGANVWL